MSLCAVTQHSHEPLYPLIIAAALSIKSPYMHKYADGKTMHVYVHPCICFISRIPLRAAFAGRPVGRSLFLPFCINRLMAFAVGQLSSTSASRHFVWNISNLYSHFFSGRRGLALGRKRRRAYISDVRRLLTFLHPRLQRERGREREGERERERERGRPHTRKC